MTKQAKSLIIREAVPADAAALLAYLKQVSTESNYLLVTAEDYGQTPELEALALADIYESDNNLLLLALLGDEIVGMVRIAGEEDLHLRHIGEIGISVKKAYWGHQIGTMLLEDGIDWAKQTRLIRRLTLTVQQRNQRAVKLYKKLAFQVEGTLQRGYYDPKAGFIDLWQMARLLD
ncbi:GNAT family N-acetyltransferase [Agrilactobacillus yilanensis]|uniref:GNAT family N-acetyltransferase n=1 Tax=Agrilactobacillus yilanensis TaxID=2485997 RepID=A0ABW4J944_9LACO|nr:GNAT family N-acetyltransferase [Agrilactobacillus yilanensis]